MSQGAVLVRSVVPENVFIDHLMPTGATFLPALSSQLLPLYPASSPEVVHHAITSCKMLLISSF
jgi:hypothetical protein